MSSLGARRLRLDRLGRVVAFGISAQMYLVENTLARSRYTNLKRNILVTAITRTLLMKRKVCERGKMSAISIH